MKIEPILDYLAQAEGLELHRNETEDDITSPYGIYKSIHPNEEIFNYIKTIGEDFGFPKNTRDWSKENINTFNELMSYNQSIQTEIRNLARIFYLEYYSSIHLDLFPEEAQLAFISMYTTTTKHSKIAVQKTLQEIHKNGFINTKITDFDGIFGKIETIPALKESQQIYKKEGLFYGLWFEQKMITQMILHYDKLAIENPQEYKRYYKGWRDRMLILGKKV